MTQLHEIIRTDGNAVRFTVTPTRAALKVPTYYADEAFLVIEEFFISVTKQSLPIIHGTVRGKVNMNHFPKMTVVLQNENKNMSLSYITEK